ncbi:MAG TPA: hypothetical protein PLT82_01975 [Candidatus Hydrogenedens sp.]|nr:hypothetical protein [Candidatus Hydrogenedens sp.]HOL20447.1 hypothetical protein [Candidatus Hydrogenedens sp.]HPP57878.1 hypothetical protein [Candidatus Hydrogenedens sp.]
MYTKKKYIKNVYLPIKFTKNIFFLFPLIISLSLSSFFLTFNIHSQDFLEGLLSGKIISSEPGVWAIYEILDKISNTHVLLRQAITGTEVVDKDTNALWLESEIIPLEGFPSVYRFLISYDSKGKETIHKIIVREGAEPPKNIDVTTISDSSKDNNLSQKKKFINEEEVTYKNGKIKSKHYKIENNGQIKDIWLNDDVKPLGIVKLTTNDGEMTLIQYGKGGNEGKSSLDFQGKTNLPQQMQESTHVDVSTGNKPTKKPSVINKNK